jgi:DNA (cytosine-5)-methyltransferase 1
MDKMRLLDLFSGIGGFSLGLERSGGFETVAFCEIEPFPRRVLAKHWPEVPCYHDIKELTADRLAADGITVDAISGGSPCQDISSAGKKAGITGERSGLWSEYARLIGELRPRVAFLENSAELLNRGLGDVLGDLAARGYSAEWQCISAASIGAPHGRDRVWIVAYPDDQSEPVGAFHDETRRLSAAGGDLLANAQRRIIPLGGVMERAGRLWQSSAWDGIWDIENSPLGMGVDDGLPDRMDRLKALGNSVVPAIPELLGRAYLQAMETANG